MKILIATGIFTPETGGPATFAAELGRRLCLQGDTVEVLTYSDRLQYDLDADFPFKITRIIRRKNKLINYFSYFIAAWRRVADNDIVYGLDWFSAGVPLMVACLLRRKKYVMRVGGGYIWEKYLAEGNEPVTLRQFYEKRLYVRYPLLFRAIGLVLRRAQYVIFNSDEQKILYQKFYSLHPAKTVTIYNATPEPVFSESGFDENNERVKEIVFAGRLIKMKNIENLISAFARITNESCRLIIIGNGPLRDSLSEQVDRLHLGGRVDFIPAMKQEELYRRIARSYLIVIPSWTDISPHQAIECLQMNIPFLLTKENFLPIRKDIPLQIDPASVENITAIITQLLEPAEYKNYIQALGAVTFEWRWEDVIVEHEKIFSKLIRN